LIWRRSDVMKTVGFMVSGMHCRSCEMLLKDALNELGVSKAEASHKEGKVVVAFDERKVNIEDIKKAILKEGYEVVSNDD